MRILLVEDEAAIARDVASALEASGFVVETVSDGEEAWFRGGTEEFGAIVLDLGLPRLDGLTVVRRLRSEGVAVPILILTARGAWLERVEGIDAGADDYLTKPFHVEELIARLGALLRRVSGHTTPVMEAGPLTVDTRRLRVLLAGRSIDLSPLEFRLIRYLVHQKGRVVPQSELSEHVYGGDREPDSNTLEALVARIRKKIGPEIIATRRGHGYTVGEA
jgi:two-component system OmpR family response regulator